MSLTLGVPRELSATEKRIALVPEVISKFRKLGVQVVVEAGAGEGALLPDSAFNDAEVLTSSDEVFARADIMLFVSPPDNAAINRLTEGSVAVGFMAAHTDPQRVKLLRDRKITAFSVELIPRISRAQSMDALSSQASVAGYKAVLLAAQTSGKFFPMLTTAAGTIRPSKVLIIGAGVAGLQALATARRLGAVTFGYDVRPETKEQIESLGAKFVDLSVEAAGEGGYARELTDDERQQQQQALAAHIADMNVVITTAAIPGRPAPKIITRAMVEGMKPGSVIIDIAAETGGNCELTRVGETVIHYGVSVVGPINLASQLAMDSSQMYARNLYNFLSPMITDGQFAPDWDDQVMAESVLTHAGEIKHQKTKELVEGDGS